MKTTLTLATNLHISPFDVFDRDTDEVIMLINYFLIIGEESDGDGAKTVARRGDNQEKIKVNDSTATGGWW